MVGHTAIEMVELLYRGYESVSHDCQSLLRETWLIGTFVTP